MPIFPAIVTASPSVVASPVPVERSAVIFPPTLTVSTPAFVVIDISVSVPVITSSAPEPDVKDEPSFEAAVSPTLIAKVFVIAEASITTPAAPPSTPLRVTLPLPVITIFSSSADSNAPSPKSKPLFILFSALFLSFADTITSPVAVMLIFSAPCAASLFSSRFCCASKLIVCFTVASTLCSSASAVIERLSKLVAPVTATFTVSKP